MASLLPVDIVEPGWMLRLLQRVDFPHKLGICERLFGRALAPHGVSWIRTSTGLPWKLDLGLATHRWIVYGKYEGRPFLDWARGHLPPDGIVVDSGANIGQMLLYLAQWVPDGKVFAFEPGEEAAAWLAECLAANPHLPVEILRCGLGAVADGIPLVSTGPPGTHGSFNQIRKNGHGKRVDVLPLAEIVRERGIDCVDLWKLDVEGYELEALAGAEDLLSGHRVRAVYVELAFGHGEEIRRSLERHGYDCFLFDAAGELVRPRILPEHINGLFLPR